ncbi:MAG: hypothetical protein D6808_06785, partial [Candidatus Dadabacteria bacterium]
MCLIHFFIGMAVWLHPIRLYAQTPLGRREQVVIGFILPLTGEKSEIGKALKDLASTLEGHLNRRSRYFNYSFVFKDGKCGEGKKAQDAAGGLIRIFHAKFIITFCDEETSQAAHAARNRRIVIMSVGALFPIKTLGTYVFRISPSLEAGIKELMSKMVQNGVKRLGIMYDGAPANSRINYLIRSVLRRKASEIIPTPELKDLHKELLTRVKEKKLDGMFLNCKDYASCAYMMGNIAALRLPIMLFSHNPVFGTDKFHSLFAKYRPYYIAYLSYPKITFSSPDFISFIDAFSKERKLNPSLR